MKFNFFFLKSRPLLTICLCGLLISCSEDNTALYEARIAELNDRIDQLGIVRKELAAKATTLDEVEAQLTRLEEDTRYQLQSFASRDRVARETITKIDAEMAEKLNKIKELEKEVDNYAASNASPNKDADQRLADLVKNLNAQVDLAPKPGEERVVLMERILATMQALREENANLRAALRQPQKPQQPE